MTKSLHATVQNLKSVDIHHLRFRREIGTGELEAIEFKARCDGASDECPSAEAACALPLSGWNDDLRPFAVK